MPRTERIISIRDLDLRGQRELRKDLKFTLKHFGKEPYDLSSVSSVPSPEASDNEGNEPAGTRGEAAGESSCVLFFQFSIVQTLPES